MNRYTVLYLFFLMAFALACANDNDERSADTASGKLDTTDPVFDPHAHSKDTNTFYHNETFKDVLVKKTGETTYEVTGRARVFEAVYHYLVKDGNEVVTDGHGMTDAGAPEFGKFSFTIDVKKKVATESLSLVLFESSAKDGSMQHELPIPLN